MKFFVIAGEPSGDALGAALMAGLRERVPDVAFDGVGGPGMIGQGLTSRFPMDELTVMGLVEVIPRYLPLKRRIAELARIIADTRPDALITIDSPDFGLRVAGAARALWPGLRTCHYVAPSVWAWRPGRAAKMARMIEHVLALLPFEPPYMQAAGMSCDFVGHPIATAPVATPAEGMALRARLGLEGPVVLALPGSRPGEIARLAPRFGAAMAQLDARVILPTLDHLRDQVTQATADWRVTPCIVSGPDRLAAFAAGDAALAASGTVSLDLAAHDVPMVIGYDVAPLSRLLMGWLMRTDTVTLVNLVSETRAVPEFLGRDCHSEPMAQALAALLREGPERAAQHAAAQVTMDRLGRGGPPPGLRAADSVLRWLTPAPPPR